NSTLAKSNYPLRRKRPRRLAVSRDSFPFDPRENDASFDRTKIRPTDSPRAPVPQDRESGNELESNRRAHRSLKPEIEDRSRAFGRRRRAFLPRGSGVQAMAGPGTFRGGGAAGLGDHAYGGGPTRMERELRSLRQQGLVVERTLPTSGRNRLRVV